MIIAGFDLETPQADPAHGLQPWRARTGEATIKTAAIWSPDSRLRKTIRMPSKNALRSLLLYAAENKVLLAGWHVVFDVAWLHAIGLTDEVRRCKWMDAELALKRLDPWRAAQFGGPGFGLKAAVAEEWPEHKDYAIDPTKVPETEDEWRIMCQYNLDDSKFTALLSLKYLRQMTDSERKGLIIECEGIPEVALSYINGIPLNLDSIGPYQESVAKMQAEAEEILGHDVSLVRSPKKLAKLLYEDWGLPIIKRAGKDGKGNPSTDKETLMKLAIHMPEDPRFKALMELRKCNTRQSKFINSTLASAEYHGENITRPEPTMSGSYTGRFSYSSFQGKNKGKIQTGIALHQWERGPEARSLLAAPKGFLLLEFDFSGQEMRLMAIKSQDETMLDLFANDGDGHAYMGAEIENLNYEWVREKSEDDEVAKAARYLGKFANLSLQYRIGEETITIRALTQYNLQMGRARARFIKNTYLKTYPGVRRYWNSAIREANVSGYAETYGHRRVPLPNLQKYEQQQTAINFPIQGTGGDMKALAIGVCRPYFGPDLLYAWDLHDALFMYIRDNDQAIPKALEIKKLLSNLPYTKYWGWRPDIPLPVDAKIGPNWGELKKI